jgi:hypothetical protein
MLHKLRVGMVRPDRDRIGGEWPVEVDQTLVGSKTRGAGRGVHRQTYVIGAVEVRVKQTKRGRRSVYAGRLRLHALEDKGQALFETLVAENIQPASRVITDGAHGYAHLKKMGFDHESAAGWYEEKRPGLVNVGPDVTKSRISGE